MFRLSLTARIGLLVVGSLVVAWIGSVAIFYLSMAHKRKDVRPLPSQIAALVELVEMVPAAERRLVLRAVTSQGMTARVEPGLHVNVTPNFQRVSRLTERALNEYLAGLGGRPNSVTASGPNGSTGALASFSFVVPLDLELRIGLKTGETLIVDVDRMPLRSVLGLPVGFVAGLLGTAIGLVALFLANRQLQPLARLAAALDGFDLAGSPGLALDMRSGAPEIRALLAAFSRLRTRLSQLLLGRMAMLGGISHDVRTFATRLRLRVEQIPEAAGRERAVADIADMIRLLDDALLATRAGAGELDQELVELDEVVLAEIGDRRVEGKAVELRDAGRAWADAVVLGDRLALRRVVANLVDNALKYGGAALLNLETRAQTVSLTVDDKGSGIPPEWREAVLEPFVRLDDSRSRRTGGAGLGLAVVRNLVEAHRGTLRISEAPGGGARLTVCLPVFEAARSHPSEQYDTH